MKSKIDQKNLQKYRDFLIGDINEFSMEHRAFNAVCLFTLLLLIASGLINLYVGILPLAALCAVAFFVQILFYYLSRFKRLYLVSVITYAAIVYVMLWLNFKLDAGLEGPIFMAFGLMLLLLIAILPKKITPYFVVFHVLIALLFALAEYYHPEWILNPYKSKSDEVFDIVGTFIIITLLVYFTINFILSNYRSEKALADKRALSIATQHKQIIEQKQKLEALNEEKNKLFSIISHDLRSPVNSMQGYLELMMDQHMTQEEMAEMKQELLDLTKNTSQMLQNLLLWAQAQMKGAGLQLKAVHIHDILTKATDYQKSIALKKGIDLRILPFADKLVFADSDMLELVLRNLVNNAIKFTNSGGFIEIEVRNHKANTEILVRDNGIDISAEKQQDLFTALAHSTYGTENEKGLGLGLMLCKEYIELQQGSIHYESRKDGGSVFSIQIPNMK
jgi:signal transduction histidine kinase